MKSFPTGGLAVVIGASGGIGGAIADALQADGTFSEILRYSRGSEPAIDLTSEPSIARAATGIAQRGELRLVFDATGFLHDDAFSPEKSWSQIDLAHMQKSFALNAIGPALLMKHLLPQLTTDGKTVFATLSAKVGSIGDNHLGGWYAYRASKAALNQLVRTASVELKRKRPHAICVALHPGTVATGLTGPFAKTGLDVQTPHAAAADLLEAIDKLQPDDSGGFLDRFGQPIPW
ncbi:SDR family NAD(P)-dependent oxidoreductase [Tardiphaga sp.]|uniref:SDR family NAD(P)-dependent oxidoreductase n=1 Tax=Tardiphaga sp. TaxID=1926292 RepID=UPI0025FC3005|nr:SDR family NAD(P)-dependent oxidoreductase [Tardiphaga sp.]